MSKPNIQNPFKSPVFWTSLITFIALILKLTNVWVIDDKSLSDMIDLILGIVTAFGLINSPKIRNAL